MRQARSRVIAPIRRFWCRKSTTDGTRHRTAATNRAGESTNNYGPRHRISTRTKSTIALFYPVYPERHPKSLPNQANESHPNPIARPSPSTPIAFPRTPRIAAKDALKIPSAESQQKLPSQLSKLRKKGNMFYTRQSRVITAQRSRKPTPPRRRRPPRRGQRLRHPSGRGQRRRRRRRDGRCWRGDEMWRKGGCVLD